MSMRRTNHALLLGPFLDRDGHISGTKTAITPLPTVIHKGGFDLTLVRRAGRAAIYRQHFPRDNPAHDAYEVILPLSRTTNHKGQPVEPYEGYPAAESWGKKGWTFTELGKAVQKLEQLAHKASCRGTVSRKNRFDARRSHWGRSLAAKASRFVLTGNNLVSPSPHTRVQRQVKESFGPGRSSTPSLSHTLLSRCSLNNQPQLTDSI